MASYFYINTSGSKVETASIINMCERRGMMSFCRAATKADQKGCKYWRESEARDNQCMYFCEHTNGACDNMYAQNNLEAPYLKKK